MSKQYTAVLEINVTEHADEKKDRYGNIEISYLHKESEVTRLVLRAATLESLSNKLANHIALIEED